MPIFLKGTIRKYPENVLPVMQSHAKLLRITALFIRLNTIHAAHRVFTESTSHSEEPLVRRERVLRAGICFKANNQFLGEQ